ncbi:MAG: EI24 domain-containing protein, partial [Lentisphaeria bacterium]|nr:EI24 domain-containing protein [Lentisphaeria bacterium]
DSFGSVIEFLVYAIVSIGVAFFIYFFFVAIASIVSIPFMDLLSSEIELKVTNSSESASFWLGIQRGIQSTLIMMLRMLLVMFVSLPLLFVPLVGSVLYFLINAWYMAYGYLDYPMGRKGWTFRDKKSFMKNHKREQLFLGCFIYAMSLIPLLNLFVIPWATAASTLLFIRIDTHHQLNREKSRKSIEHANQIV